MQLNALRELLTAAVRAEVAAHGDLPPGLQRLQPTRPKQAAAVLIPVIAHPAGPTVLLTLRATALAYHAGQISFPGGRIEPADSGPVDAALRETWEEVGIEPSSVEIVGTLTPYMTVTNFRVTPVLGLVTPGFVLRPDPIEVADAFEIPLATFRDPALRERRRRQFGDVEVSYWAYQCDGRLVWGATAAMLVDLCRRLDAI
ncbi:MAG: CoA pyrophosphatase [Xanthomonadaceae bacterium]|nr:CoA pyrophosphatase [Xanthomonadaceae bacterium]